MAHDRDIPIRSYASPNLYDFNHRIAYIVCGENARFEIKPVMLQMIQNAGQFDDNISCRDVNVYGESTKRLLTLIYDKLLIMHAK